MKTSVKHLMALSVILLLGFLMLSCSDDDNSEVSSDDLLGTWYGVSFVCISEEDTPESWEGYVMNIKEDGTLTFDDTWSKREGSWGKEEGNLYIILDNGSSYEWDGNAKYRVDELTSNKLVLRGGLHATDVNIITFKR